MIKQENKIPSISVLNSEYFRVLGIDYGTKRIGLAISDETRTFARELSILSPKDFWNEIKNICNENEVGDLVVGLPLGLDGKNTEKTKEVLAFVEKLKKYLPDLQVKTQDERLSSAMAKNLPGGKTKVDSLAAQIFLQNYLDRNKQ